MHRNGFGDLTLDFASETFNEAYKQGFYRRQRISGKTFETFYLIKSETNAGSFELRDEKVSGGKNQTYFGVKCSSDESSNYNTGENKVLQHMSSLELGSPQTMKYKGGFTWTWEWESNGFKCYLGYGQSSNYEGFNYGCSKEY